MTLFTLNVIKVFSLAAVASAAAIIWCPLLTHFLYKHKLWKKTARQKAISGEDAVFFNNLHREKEVGTPRMGGLLIWITVVFITFIFFKVVEDLVITVCSTSFGLFCITLSVHC